MKYRAVIFDMDGTILNTLEDLTDSTNAALKKFEFPERTMDEVRKFVGHGILRLIEQAVPTGSDQAIINKVYEYFISYYQEHCAVKTSPYEGIPELIQELKRRGYLVAVVSNKADIAVRELSERYFKGMFDCVVGERVGIRKKPYPDSVNETMLKLGVKKEESVYVGDSEVDVETAQNAYMDSILVEWGFRDREQLISCGARVLVKEPFEILDLL